jgi:hypothetical protein
MNPGCWMSNSLASTLDEDEGDEDEIDAFSK